MPSKLSKPRGLCELVRMFFTRIYIQSIIVHFISFTYYYCYKQNAWTMIVWQFIISWIKQREFLCFAPLLIHWMIAMNNMGPIFSCKIMIYIKSQSPIVCQDIKMEKKRHGRKKAKKYRTSKECSAFKRRSRTSKEKDQKSKRKDRKTRES